MAGKKMEDEEIIKRRLMFDGDGTGEERRLDALFKQILEWTYSKDTSPENNQIIYDRICAQLAQCQLDAAKSDDTIKRLEMERKNYSKVNKEIQKNIKLAEEEIEECKDELAKAKEIRKTKMEYNSLAKVIKKQPDREKTSGEIETLKKEIEELTDLDEKLTQKIEKRSKDFTLLMLTINELKQSLEENSAESDQSGDENPTVAGGVKLEDFVDDDVPSTSKQALMKMLKTKKSQEKKNFEAAQKKDQAVGDEQKQQESVQSKEQQQQHQVTAMEEDAILELSLDKDEKSAVLKKKRKKSKKN